MLCLKGLNATKFVNLDAATSLNLSDPIVHQALERYQNLTFPNLTDCLRRRQELLVDFDAPTALQQLATELAVNFSLDAHNIAGEANLLKPIEQEVGFVDLSGAMAGRRLIQFSGKPRTYKRELIDSPLTAAREALWYCARDGATDRLPPCIEDVSLVMPGFKVADGINRSPGRLTVDRRFSRVQDVGDLHIFEYMRESIIADTIDYVPRSDIVNDIGTETAYRDAVDRPLFLHAMAPTAVNWPPGLDIARMRCFVRDSCFDLCNDMTTNGLDFYLAFDDGNGCVLQLAMKNVINEIGFVNESCYGIGTGTSAIKWVIHEDAKGTVVPGNLTHYVFNHTTDPFQVMACIIGGRVPSRTHRSIPRDLLDNVYQPTNMILTQTFSRGSEKLIANFCAILALFGCVAFAACTCWEAGQSWVVVRRYGAYISPSAYSRLLLSLTSSNVSTRVWAQHGSLLQTFGFVGIVAWYVRSVRTYCTWFVESQDLWEMDALNLPPEIEPVYGCLAGSVAGVFATPMDVLRLLSVSYVVFILSFGGPSVRGLTRTWRGLSLGVLLLGTLPTVAIASVVTWINAARINGNALHLLHNQLFIVCLWTLALTVMRAARFRIVKGLTFVFQATGIARQQVGFTHMLHLMIGDYYFVARDEWRSRPVTTFPLSMLLECPKFSLTNVDIATGTYEYTPSRHTLDLFNHAIKDPRMKSHGRSHTKSFPRNAPHQEYVVHFAPVGDEISGISH